MKQGFIYAIEIAEWVKIGWSAAYNRVAVTNLTQMLHHYNILNLSDISESPIRALRNRCSDPTPIEQRRGAVRRLGFAPIPGRRSNSEVRLGGGRERAIWDDPEPHLRSQTIPSDGCKRLSFERCPRQARIQCGSMKYIALADLRQHPRNPRLAPRQDIVEQIAAQNRRASV